MKLTEPQRKMLHSLYAHYGYMLSCPPYKRRTLEALVRRGLVIKGADRRYTLTQKGWDEANKLIDQGRDPRLFPGRVVDTPSGRARAYERSQGR